MFKFIYASLFCGLSFISLTQIVKMDSCWTSPIGITPELSAGFGDIRPNHFHMGLDFRTNGVEGVPLFAIADGYISRIRISSLGYGRVLYINHPNGITSVYAHCSRFSDRITSFMQAAQIQFQQNEFDWSLSPEQLPISKGEQIALSGNSGNSTGPHLHFELRDSKTEHALNPLLHGFHVTDNASPILHALRIVAIDQNGYMIPGKSMNLALMKEQQLIQIPKDFVSENEKIGVCIFASDPMKAGGHGFGLFAADLSFAQSEHVGFELKEMSFDDSRYVNNHIDYDEYKAKGTKYQKLFRTKNNPLGIYTMQSIGGIQLNGNDSIVANLVLSDVNGNKSQHTLQFIYPYSLKSTSPIFYSLKDFFLPDSSYVLLSDKMMVEVDANTFYEPSKKILNLSIGQVGLTKTVIQKAICISMKALDGISMEKQYISIAETALETSRDGTWLRAESKQLGTFTIKTDTTSPIVQYLPGSSNVMIPKYLTWKISDKQSGIKQYNLFIDGRWTPIYFDQKKNMITWENTEHISIIGPNNGKTLTFTLKVMDMCGNEAEWTKNLPVIDEPH